ncbi:serine protease FAM111A-like isoform X2 [Pungitius pungitius]|uniref:serine protease FAM111A-like isoform X2 n=1 Tax=Pungitius pungitius TaxID=134920 RepID=UPI002E10F80F
MLTSGFFGSRRSEVEMDIRRFLRGKQPTDGADGAAGMETVLCKVNIKEEMEVETMEGHSHTFRVKFSPTHQRIYDIHCDRPRTVLQAMKSSEKYQEMSFTDGNIVIQLGEVDKKYAVATHFPCSCVRDDEILILSHKKEEVEASQNQGDRTVHSRDEYSVFYIDTVGGHNAKSKHLFKDLVFKRFKYLCVYGEKGITVEEALKRDGRFLDLGYFILSNNKSPNRFTERGTKVDHLDGKEFKIRLPLNANPGTPKTRNEAAAGSLSKTKEKATAGFQSKTKEKATAGFQSKTKEKATAGLQSKTNDKVIAVLQQRGTRVIDGKGNHEEIIQMLRNQFPVLKKLMKSRFSGQGSYKKALNLRREDFGKIQHAFSEVHRVMKLMELGKSVCKVIVKDGMQGTGFVLFDNFILTNAHLLKGWIEEGKLKEGIEVYFTFNCVEPEPHTDNHYFELAQSGICYSEDGLDYAILEINPQAKNPDSTTTAEQIKVPPGLLKRFGPKPPDGQGCILGHPAGGLKKMDPICIIEKENREQAVISNLGNHKDDEFVLHVISNGIEKDPLADVMISYNTFMYHGASGSPVFDTRGKVFGLHTAGFHHGFDKSKDSLIEFGQPLLNIFQDFVRKLNKELLKRVEEEAQGNPDLEKLLNSVKVPETEPAGPDEHSAMETDN